MLTIRDEQMSALALDFDERFIERVTREFAAWHDGSQTVRARILQARQRAARYGIFRNEDVAWFIGLDLKLGAEWELRPGMTFALGILENTASDLAGRRFRLDKALVKWKARNELS
jgi:hypothetical protein